MNGADASDLRESDKLGETGDQFLRQRPTCSQYNNTFPTIRELGLKDVLPTWMLMSVDVALAVQPSGNIAHASNR